MRRLQGDEGTAEPRPLADLREASSAMTPKLFLFSRKIPSDGMTILLKYFQCLNLIYHFPEQTTDRAIHLCPNRFIGIGPIYSLLFTRKLVAIKETNKNKK